MKKIKNSDSKKQLVELEAKWKRALADYQNLEKRIEGEKRQFVKLANATLIEKLLSVLDNLERALKHINDSGLKIIVDEFRVVLKSEGIEEIKAKSKEFDPSLMDCSSLVSGKKDRVVKVIRKGYKLNDVVIRPVKVEVGKGRKIKSAKD